MIIPILIGTHQYEWAIQIFSRLFSKYWGDETIIYYGDRQEGELPSNIEFRQVPCYSEGEWPWRYWFGNGLMSVCDAMAGEIVALFLPDHWINQPVNIKVIYTLEKYMRLQPDLMRVNLTGDASWNEAEADAWEDVEILETKPWDIHNSLNGGITFCPSLWRMEKLKKKIEPHWNLWECERLGTERVKMAYQGVTVVGSKPAALSRTHALVHSQSKVVNLGGLSQEDRDMIMPFIPGGWKHVN